MTQQYPPGPPQGPGQPYQQQPHQQHPQQQPYPKQQGQPQQQWTPGQPPTSRPRRTKGILPAVAAAGIVVGVALTLILTLTGGPDLSSPQAAAQSWVDAVNDKDAEAVIDTVCPAQATAAPDDAIAVLQQSLDASPGGATVQKVESVDATTAKATVNVPAGTTDTTFTSTTVLDLRRIDGDWYVCGGGPTPAGG